MPNITVYLEAHTWVEYGKLSEEVQIQLKSNFRKKIQEAIHDANNPG